MISVAKKINMCWKIFILIIIFFKRCTLINSKSICKIHKEQQATYNVIMHVFLLYFNTLLQ